MKEGLRGVEALAAYPLKDIILKPDEALSLLTKMARKNYVNNVNVIISSFDPKSSKIIPLPQKKSAEISIGELPLICKDWGDLTLKRATKKAMEESFPEILDEEDPSNNLNIICAMHLLNTLRIIDPKIATFEEGIATMIEGVRKSDTCPSSFVILGGILTEAILLKGTEDVPFDLLVDVDGAKAVRNYVFRSVGMLDKLNFGIGIDYANEAQTGRVLFSRS